MLYLQEMAKQGQQNRTVILSDRLPHFIIIPCNLYVTFKVDAKEDFYLIHLHTQGTLRSQCQRCLDEFSFPYDNETEVAICRDEQRANELLERYECIVSAHCNVTLEDLLLDELYLYAPQSHPENKDCSNEINQFLSGKE
jgi:uncharacterized protein